MNCIYGYKKIDEDKIVYVGQTCNLKERRRRHEQIDPYTPSCSEYNYPLSRGIRKYGLENYSCIILEDNIPDNCIDDREMHWIKYYNTYNDPKGYNQTAGGKGGYKYQEYSKEQIDLAKQFIKNGIPFKEISEKLNMPVVNLSEINTGKRHFDADEIYPLYELTRGRKLTKEKIIQLQIDLQNGTPLALLEKKYNIQKNYISAINTGRKYYNPNLSYPLHKYKVLKITDDIVIKIIEELQNTNYTMKQIGSHFDISDVSVQKINSGERHRLTNYNYPIRK